MNPLRLAATLAFATVLGAQTAAAPPAPQLAPHLVIETVGPDGWRARLGPTNLGSLLASEQGQHVWQPLVAPLFAGWQQAAGDDATFALQRERLLGYAGRVQIALWFDVANRPFGDATQLAIVLEPDGRTDMPALAADLLRLQRAAEGTWAKTAIDGIDLEVLRHEQDTMTGFAFVDGAVAAAMRRDGDVAEPFAAARAMARRATGKAPPPTAPAFRLELDVAALVAAANVGLAEHDREEMAFLGLDSLARAQFTIGSAGPHVQFEVQQQFVEAPKGLFAAFFPPVAGIPVLQRAVPASGGSWRVGRFSFQALFEAFLMLSRTRALPDAENARAEMKESLGIDLGDDLIAHMTDEVLAFGSPLDVIDRPEDFTWAVAVSLRDEKKFAAGLDTLLAKSKPSLTRTETTTIHGVECHRYGNVLNYGLWFAVGHGTFFFAGGGEAEERLTQLLGALATAPAADAAAKPAEQALADVTRFLPPGVNAAARGDLDSLFAVPLEWWGMLLDDIVGLPGADGRADDPEAVANARALLKEHHLDTLRTATGYADATWRWRLWW